MFHLYYNQRRMFLLINARRSLQESARNNRVKIYTGYSNVVYWWNKSLGPPPIRRFMYQDKVRLLNRQEQYRALSINSKQTQSSLSVSKEKKEWKRQLRIIQTLGSFVWPSSTFSSNIEKDKDDMNKQCPTQLEHKGPYIHNNNAPLYSSTNTKIVSAALSLDESPWEIKEKVLLSIGLLVGRKIVTIGAPYLFKHLIDSVSFTMNSQQQEQEVGVDAMQQTLTNTCTTAVDLPIVVYESLSSSLLSSPLVLALAYGVVVVMIVQSRIRMMV